jgi:succinylglutamate desuccinylase
VLGTYDAGVAGPTVAIVAGMHGNEPAGIAAAQRLLSALRGATARLRGRLVALAGNLSALAAGQRFLERDLNRLWTADQITRLEGTPPADDDTEQAEQRALLSVLRTLGREAEGAGQELVVLDLHSTSAPSAPFAIINDTLRSRALALAVPIPLVLGLEESVRGALIDYTADAGHEFVGLEGGEHHAPATAELLEAAVWHVLVKLGALRREDVPDLAAHAERLRRAASGAPGVVEVLYRHEIAPGDDFRMEPGFRSFQPVRAGHLLARDRRGPVAAPLDGLLLLPLYQERGEDGFFIARPVGRGWLTVSRVLRALRVDRVLPLLPGVSHHSEHRDVVLVNRHAARWLVVEIFHLAGYRRLPTRDGRAAFRHRHGP